MGSAALVYDNSFFGVTSPILGQRYRFEVSPTVGALNYVGVLADFRRYFMPIRRFTFAARLLHYGRYAKDGEDPVCSRCFLARRGWCGGTATAPLTARNANRPRVSRMPAPCSTSCWGAES